MNSEKNKQVENKEEYEFDSDRERWEYYQKLYKESFKINEGEIIVGVKVKRICKKADIKYGRDIELSGDCFFNFKKKEKIEKFENIVKNDRKNTDEKLKQELYEKLDLYSEKKHHSNENCILLPVSGGLNNIKGKCHIRKDEIIVASRKVPHNAYDRPDTFVYLINDFYEKKDTIKDIKLAGDYFTNSIFKHSLQSENFSF